MLHEITSCKKASRSLGCITIIFSVLLPPVTNKWSFQVVYANYSKLSLQINLNILYGKPLNISRFSSSFWDHKITHQYLGPWSNLSTPIPVQNSHGTGILLCDPHIIALPPPSSMLQGQGWRGRGGWWALSGGVQRGRAQSSQQLDTKKGWGGGGAMREKRETWERWNSKWAAAM